MRIWRISKWAHAACDGEGARLYGSRWTSRGQRAVFASATLSLAALERFVHTDPELEPDDLVTIAIDVPDDMRVDTIPAGELPYAWRGVPAPLSLAALGDRWLREGTSAVFDVPSVVIPQERNYILNPLHDGFRDMTIHAPEPFAFDPRMWKR